MKTGQELIESLQSSIENQKTIMSNRQDRINKGLTDMDDCFLSERLDNTGISLDQAKIGILENKGLSSFYCLRDIETNEVVSTRIVNGKYGQCHLIKDEFVGKFGRFVGRVKKESTYACKGLKESQYEAPAWACLKAGSGGGMCGVYNSYVQIFPSNINYWTGEGVN